MPKPKTAAAKAKRREKRKAKRVAKRVLTAVASQPIGGGGKYHRKNVTRLSGRGNYVSDVVDAVSGVANYAPSSGVGKATQGAASSLARHLGLPGGIANSVGNAASWFTKLFGFGKYSTFNDVKSNSFLGSGASGFVTNAPPTFAGSSRQTTIRIKHDEFVGDILSSVNFRKTTYALNPGNVLLMPWGSSIASLYEEFVMHGLVFEYRPTSAMAVGTTSSAMGVVIQATDYDAYDDNFTDKRAMENAMFASSGMPYETVCHPVECAKSMNPANTMFISRGVPTASTLPGDARLSILGNYSIATQGQQADGTKIGELWVHYDLELSRPVLEGSRMAFTQHIQGQLNWVGTNNMVARNSNASTGFAATAKTGAEWYCVRLDVTEALLPGNYFICIRTAANVTTVGLPVAQFRPSGSVSQMVNNSWNATSGLMNQGSLNNFGIDNAAFSYTVSAVVVTVTTGAGYLDVGIYSGGAGISYYDIYIMAYDVLYNAPVMTSAQQTEATLEMQNELSQLKSLVRVLTAKVDSTERISAAASSSSSSSSTLGILSPYSTRGSP